MQLKLILLIIIAAAFSVRAQEVNSRKESNNRAQSVTNEDRGRAFIITGETQPLLAVPPGKNIIEPQQQSIFLGSDWETESLREREPEMANLLSNIRDQSQLNSLGRLGMKNLYASNNYQEKILDAGSDTNITDLEIQSTLERMFKENLLQHPNANTIYVVFLDPAMHSTLGAMIAGKHYLAYHNSFNSSDMKIHYVVVPFEEDEKTAYQIALRAFLSATLNFNSSL